MPELTPHYLTFRSGLHVGTGVEGLNEARPSVPSDTLFAALASAQRALGGDVASFTAPFAARKPPFLLTSAFPFARGVRFFPMPADLSAIFSTEVLGAFEWNKPLKKIRYFSEGLLRKALNGETLDAWLFPKSEEEEPRQGVALQGGALWLLEEEIAALPRGLTHTDKRSMPLRELRRQGVWKAHTVPRVTVDRISSTSNLYQAGRAVFSEGCGLWFGVAGQSSELPRLLDTLGEAGLGGERTVGYGAFSWFAGEPFSLPDPSPDQRAYLLSRYSPMEEELPAVLAEPAAYKLEAVGGWLHTPDGAAQRRKRVWLITEGSLLAGAPRGGLRDVKPEYDARLGDVPHPVWRYGLALAVGWPR